jgi:zona occludens toxin (predicted ATPase)
VPSGRHGMNGARACTGQGQAKVPLSLGSCCQVHALLLLLPVLRGLVLNMITVTLAAAGGADAGAGPPAAAAAAAALTVVTVTGVAVVPSCLSGVVSCMVHKGGTSCSMVCQGHIQAALWLWGVSGAA